MQNKVKSKNINARKRGIRLKTALDIQRFLAKIINGVFRDEVDTLKGTKLAYICNVMLKSQELGQMEERMEERIKALEQGKQN